MFRRDALKSLFSGSLVALATMLKPISALAKWNKEAFAAVDYDTALNHYFPDMEIVESDRIKITVNPTVENGAVVPVKINTDIENPVAITIFVDKNPNPLIANFDLSPGCLGFISTRIKMEKPSNLRVTVKTNEKVFINKTFVDVKEGGCG